MLTEVLIAPFQHKVNISSAKTWEDLDNKTMIRKGEWKVESFFKKATTSKGWG